MDEFSEKHSGAKSNNLKNIRNKLENWIKLPESVVLPFQVAEYSIGRESSVKQKLDSLIEKVGEIKSVRKMNKMLYQCKELIMDLKFH